MDHCPAASAAAVRKYKPCPACGLDGVRYLRGNKGLYRAICPYCGHSSKASRFPKLATYYWNHQRKVERRSINEGNY